MKNMAMDSSSMDMQHMHMSEKTVGLPWLDQPVLLHSSRAASCSLTPAQCAYRNAHWRFWYQADLVYSLNTIYFLCATVGVFAIAHLLDRYAPLSLRRTALWKRANAGGRYLAYRTVRLPALRWGTSSLGVLMLGLVGVVFFFAMTLGPRPYYWPVLEKGSFGSSPPIATRAGWMALALLPFVLALSAKANLISALTGVPHEKLQVFHHWTSYAMFVLALVHTFPFIVYHIHKGDMVEEWNTSVVYWTGVAALIPQAYLTIMSLPAIRNRYYEFFKATHFLAALLFVLFFFFHCDFRLTSWDYFIASGAIYLFSLGTSLVRTHLIHGTHTASISLLPSGLLELRIPTIISWHAGQHIFLRILHPSLGLHALTAHPFTICSVSHDPHAIGRAPDLLFYIKPHRGITARLARVAAQRASFSARVLLDGPYGGVSKPGRFDSVLVVSGGSGGGFSLGVVEEVVREFVSSSSSFLYADDKASLTGGRHIEVVFATKTKDMADWYAEELEQRISLYNVSEARVSIAVSIHVTDEVDKAKTNPLPVHAQDNQDNKEVQHQNQELSKEDGKEEIQPKNPPLNSIELTSFNNTTTNTNTPQTSSSSLSPSKPTSHSNKHNTNYNYPTKAQTGRPHLPATIASFAASEPAQNRSRIGIFVCGPESMVQDVRNAAAEAQGGILGGGGGGAGSGRLEEVYLHTERFAW